MSEIKRVAFTTISSTTGVGGNGGSGGIGVTGTSVASSSALASSNSSTAAALKSQFNAGNGDMLTSQQQQKTIKGTTTKTIRLELQLFEPTSNAFPAFNFTKLLHLEKKKQKKIKQKASNGFSDPFEDNDDDVARIAKEMEKKYGASYGGGGGGGKRNKKDDFCDIGLGYDESDSFIDNTEAYDEVIPEEVETVEGGFYINSGQLEFKRLSANYEKTDEIIKMPTKARKRALSTSEEESESSGDDDEDENEKKTNSDATETAAATNKVKNGPIEKRHKSTDSDKEKKEKKFSKSCDDDAGSDSSKEREQVSEPKVAPTVKTTTVKDMLKAKRDSFLKMQEGEGKGKMANGEVKGSNESSESGSGQDDDDSDSDSDAPSEKRLKKTGDDEADKLRSSDVKLPEDLSEDLVKDIRSLKDTAKSQNRIGKNFQFDDKLSEIFLRIDDACLCLDKPIRNLVFAHLEYQLSLTKYLLLRKAKQLRIKEEKTKTRKAYHKLKKAVDAAMPSALLNYELNYRKIEELRSSMTAEDMQQAQQLPKFPKKKFPWNDMLRSLLYELFQVRWTSYTVLRTRKETFEDFVSTYLKEKVVMIWPSGWMKYEELKKELDKRKNSATKKSKDKDREKKHHHHHENTPAATADRNTSTDHHASAKSVDLPPQLTITPASNDEPKKSSKSSTGSQQANSSKNANGERDREHYNNNCVIDLVSPTKRTDHSISSLLSPTPPPVAHSNAEASSPTTHVINIDNFKNASEIIHTSNTLLDNNNIHPKQPESVKTTRRDSASSESDGVEIVGVFPGTKKSMAATSSKLKPMKEEPTDLTAESVQKIKKVKARDNLHAGDAKESEVDVNQIMKALKELEEMQTSVVHVSTPPSQSHGASNHSAQVYGKDLRQ